MTVLTVTSKASGYLFEAVKVARTQRALLARMTRTKSGLEFEKLANMPTMIIKGQDYQGVIAASTRYLSKANILDWLAEHGYYYSTFYDEFRPLEEAPEQRIKVSGKGYICRGLPQIGGKWGDLTITSFYGNFSAEGLFSGRISFSSD